MTPTSSSSASIPDIVHTVELQASIDKVWRAAATSEGIAAWFMPNDFEPAVGHEFHLNAGPFGKSPCKVTELDPPHRLSFNWGKDWTLTFELKDMGDNRTSFTVVHGGWKEGMLTEFGEVHAFVRERMNQGWAGMVGKLQEYAEEA